MACPNPYTPPPAPLHPCVAQSIPVSQPPVWSCRSGLAVLLNSSGTNTATGTPAALPFHLAIKKKMGLDEVYHVVTLEAVTLQQVGGCGGLMSVCVSLCMFSPDQSFNMHCFNMHCYKVVRVLRLAQSFNIAVVLHPAPPSPLTHPLNPSLPSPCLDPLTLLPACRPPSSAHPPPHPSHTPACLRATNIRVKTM